MRLRLICSNLTRMLQPPRLYLILDTVARAGSIRKAADRLRIASTALNRSILNVEKELGTPLFERLPRGVRLTAAGEVLIATIRRSLSDLASASSQIEQLRGLVRGTVRIACAESAANDLIPETIARYQERYPGVQFQLLVGSTAPLMASLMADENDLLLAHDPPSSDQLNVIETIKQPLCAMMRPGHPLAKRTSLRLAECQPYPVALGVETFGSRRLIDALLTKSRLTLGSRWRRARCSRRRCSRATPMRSASSIRSAPLRDAREASWLRSRSAIPTSPRAGWCWRRGPAASCRSPPRASSRR